MPTKLKNRNELAPQLTWDLTPLYADLTAFESDCARLSQMAVDLTCYRGKLGESAELLAEFLAKSDEFERLAEKVYTYANLKSDENIADNANKSRVDQLGAQFAKWGAMHSFVEPELMSIEDEKMQSFLQAPALKLYQRSLLELLREKNHILSEKEEQLLALYSDALGTPNELFSILNDADLNFGKIRDEQGRLTDLSHGSYGLFLESNDRKVRRAAFKKLYLTYQQFRNTFSATLYGMVKRHLASVSARHYANALESALSSDNIPENVYRNLIAAVHDELPHLTKYLQIRRRVLKLKQLDMYDLYCPLVPEAKAEYSFDQARELVENALQVMGPDYCQTLHRAFTERWIDVPECRGKRSGAYSGGCYDSNPYLLLNFKGTLGDVFTLAHELGHSMHSFYSNKTQNYHYADYSIFVAEVASTTNEMLLLHYLLKTKPELKSYLLSFLADEIRTTIYRQTMFAEFELDIHEAAARNQPLSADFLSKRYYELNQLYYGAVVKADKLIELEWARIPHFYYDFYVYKYATGMSAAIQFARNICSGDPTKLDAYLGFLKAGDSKDPLDILRDAGVDLSTTEPVKNALEYFGQIVAELEQSL